MFPNFTVIFTNTVTHDDSKGTTTPFRTYTTLGGKAYQEKTRFSVKVTDRGKNTSTVRVFHESQNNMMGDWGDVRQGRMLVYEFNILQKVNPSKAGEIEKMASAN